MLAIARHHHIQAVDKVPGMGDLQLDIQVFQANARVKAPYLVQRFTADHQGGRRRIRLALEEHVIEVQAPERHIAALALLREQVAVSIDQLDIARANTHFRLAVHIGDLHRNTVRHHDVIGAERHYQAALSPGNRAVQGVGQPLVLLHPKVETMHRL